jgi:hypothetical protein
LELKQQTDSEQYGVGNQFTSCCELHRLAEDDEIHNVNHEQVEEEQLEREQNESDALDAGGDYECPLECLSRLCLWLLTSGH